MQVCTWNPNDPCFGWKRARFGGVTVKNRGRWGLWVLESHGVLCSKPHQKKNFPLPSERTDSKAPKKEEDRKKASGIAGVVSTPRKITSPQNQHAHLVQ